MPNTKTTTVKINLIRSSPITLKSVDGFIRMVQDGEVIIISESECDLLASELLKMKK